MVVHEALTPQMDAIHFELSPWRPTFHKHATNKDQYKTLSAIFYEKFLLALVYISIFALACQFNAALLDQLHHL